ncbi:MAG: hypothetical protein R3178_11490, partial [Rhodothermales bacterium]|nr:hypothetical protein [Rhodothermales bacterium]
MSTRLEYETHMVNHHPLLHEPRSQAGRARALLIIPVLIAAVSLDSSSAIAQPAPVIAEEEYQKAYRLFMDRLFS